MQTEVKGAKGVDYADFVETQIVHLADVDRAARGIEARSEEEYELGSQVVRRRAWPEIVAMAVLAVAFVVALLVALTQIPAAALMSSRRASSRAAAEIRAASTPASGSTGTTTSR